MNHEPTWYQCSAHGRRLVRSCPECSSLGLTDEDWLVRAAREKGRVFSVPLCRPHGHPAAQCVVCTEAARGQ